MKGKNLRIAMLKEWLGSEAHRNAFKIKKWNPNKYRNDKPTK